MAAKVEQLRTEPEPEAPKRNLRQKMQAAMGEISRIEKRGRNEGQNYNYVKAEDVQEEVRKALIKHGIVFVPCEKMIRRLPERESKGGNAMFPAEVEMNYTFLDTESDETIGPLTFTGEGIDSQDKCLNKCRTSALKYCLQQTFLIPSGDDPEAEHHEIKPNVGSDRELTCPACGQTGTIIKGKEEWGGGWLCFKKKGGCGAKFKDRPDSGGAPEVKVVRVATAQERATLWTMIKKQLGEGAGSEWLKDRMMESQVKSKETMTIQFCEQLAKDLDEMQAPPPADDEEIPF